MATRPADLGCGLFFGGALYAAGVFAPSVIVDQLAWRNMDMLKAFLTASAASALIFRLADDAGHAPLPSRPPRNLGLFPADANVLGGALIGAGMAITGACPGTVFVQAATAVPRAGLLLAGGVAGAWLARFVRLRPSVSDGGGPASGVGAWAALAAWEAMCFAVVGGATLLDPIGGEIGVVSPVVGGALIGLAQALTVVWRKQPLGISSALGDVAGHVASLYEGSQQVAKTVGGILSPSITFAGGVMLGSWAAAQVWPRTAKLAAAYAVESQSPLVSFLGAVALGLGARIAGGCTSGHGISGLSAFRLPSMVTTAAMFAAGTLTALLL